ncbi:MAG: hypothetical protein JXA95_07745 [Spirochaetales bacterium]|nr:hypothetical protein [Spirochaetales bacterium]
MKISLCDEMIHTVLDNIEEGVYLTDGFGKACAKDILCHVNEHGISLCGSLCPLSNILKTGQKRELNLFLHHRDS